MDMASENGGGQFDVREHGMEVTKMSSDEPQH